MVQLGIGPRSMKYTSDRDKNQDTVQRLSLPTLLPVGKASLPIDQEKCKCRDFPWLVKKFSQEPPIDPPPRRFGLLLPGLFFDVVFEVSPSINFISSSMLRESRPMLLLGSPPLAPLAASADDWPTWG